LQELEMKIQQLQQQLQLFLLFLLQLLRQIELKLTVLQLGVEVILDLEQVVKQYLKESLT
jgi:hypothetical protein